MNIKARISNPANLDYADMTPVATYVIDADQRELHVLFKERVLKVYDAINHKVKLEKELTDEDIQIYFLGIPPYHLFY